jgi:flavodoxin
MKSIIVYYSYSGNTRKAAHALAKYLQDKFSAELLELQAQDESDSFFGQAKRAFFKKRAELRAINYDLSAYDLICLGTPVWAFGPAPAMNTYLDKCVGVGNKAIILFTTYGSGAGNRRCLNYMQGILSKKGVKHFNRFSIQQFQVDSEEAVLSNIKKDLRL